MKTAGNKSKKRIIIWLTSIVLVLTIIAIAFGIYVNDYYRADLVAIETFLSSKNIMKEKLSDNTLVYAPENATCGFIFYPGGKVEYTAYEPLMEALAAKGALCVLVEMPFNLAVLDSNAADGIISKYPDIENWYIGGHSLGGSMAAAYLEDNVDDYAGLILLGSYSTADLSESSLEVISIYGSEDEVLNKEKYEENIGNLPDDYTEIIIEGGCHAYFGMYGEQEGDGNPSISNAEQIEITAEEICKWMVDE